ncbi:hypothetical protein NFI96_003641 [Prochilodus magdalenae]|nr:hypothetical protein NFI96_003641 [Prochilodus magdalenae]
MIHHPHTTCSVVVLWGSCPLKNRVIQYTEKQMDYSLDLYTYRVSCMRDDRRVKSTGDEAAAASPSQPLRRRAGDGEREDSSVFYAKPVRVRKHRATHRPTARAAGKRMRGTPATRHS